MMLMNKRFSMSLFQTLNRWNGQNKHLIEYQINFNASIKFTTVSNGNTLEVSQYLLKSTKRN